MQCRTAASLTQLGPKQRSKLGIDGISRCHKISAGIDEIQIPDMASAAMVTSDALKGAAYIQCGVGLLELAEQCMRSQPSFHDPQYGEHHRDDACTTPPPQLPCSTAFRGLVPFPTTTLQPRPRDDGDMSPIHRKRRKLMRRTNDPLKAKKHRKMRSQQH